MDFCIYSYMFVLFMYCTYFLWIGSMPLMAQIHGHHSTVMYSMYCTISAMYMYDCRIKLRHADGWVEEYRIGEGNRWVCKQIIARVDGRGDELDRTPTIGLWLAYDNQTDFPVLDCLSVIVMITCSCIHISAITRWDKKQEDYRRTYIIGLLTLAPRNR